MKKIQIPDFVKQKSEEDLLEFAKEIASGDVAIYAMVRDENSNIVDKKQVFFKDKITDELLYINDKIMQKNEMLKKCKNKYKRILIKEIVFLKILYKNIAEYPTYSTLFKSEEMTEYSEMVKIDLASTFKTIKSYTMKKTD